MKSRLELGIPHWVMTLATVPLFLMRHQAADKSVIHHVVLKMP
jgi:hypothetical protein